MENVMLNTIKIKWARLLLTKKSRMFYEKKYNYILKQIADEEYFINEYPEKNWDNMINGPQWKRLREARKELEEILS